MGVVFGHNSVLNVKVFNSDGPVRVLWAESSSFGLADVPCVCVCTLISSHPPISSSPTLPQKRSPGTILHSQP